VEVDVSIFVYHPHRKLYYTATIAIVLNSGPFLNRFAWKQQPST